MPSFTPGGPVTTWAVRTVTGSVTLSPNDQVVEADASSGALAVTLPAASQFPAQWFLVRKSDTSSNTVTVSPPAPTQTIGGAPSITLTAPGDEIGVLSDGSVWQIWTNANIRFRDAWASGVFYAERDAVTNNGGLYLCATPHTSGASFSGAGANWTQLVAPNGTFADRNAATGVHWAVKGLYARTQPTPNYSPGNPTQIRPLAVDPNFTGANGTGRLWVTDKLHGNLGFTDDDGATYTPKIANPTTDVPAAGFVGLYFVTDGSNNKWMFAVTGTSSQTPCSGEVWRSPAPASDGSGIVFTCVWRANGLSLGPGSGATFAPNNATLRNSSFCVDSSGHALINTYGAPNTTFQPAAWTDVAMGMYSDRLIGLTDKAGSWLLGTTVTVAGAGAAGADLTTKIIGILQAGNGTTQPAVLLVNNPSQSAVFGATCTFPNQSYGAGVVQGGPVIYHSSNIFTATAGNVTWTQVAQFPNAKHGHAVKIINGLPWASFGDMGAEGAISDGQEAIVGMAFPGLGIWTATSLTNPTTWNQRTNPGGNAGADSTGMDPINMIPVTVNGQPMVLCESDGSMDAGPLMFTSQSGTANRALLPTCHMPAPYTQTMRSLAVDSNGNAFWAGISESGSHGPTDCVWMAPAPYNVPILLEDTGSPTGLSTEILGDAVISNGYFWLGTQRCVIEKLVGQA